jgi:hypothetical protein
MGCLLGQLAEAGKAGAAAAGAAQAGRAVKPTSKALARARPKT